MDQICEVAGASSAILDRAEVEPGQGSSSLPIESELGLLLNGDALARLLQVSKRSLMRLRSAGKLPRPVQLGRSVRWRSNEIREWVDAGCPPLVIWEPTTDSGRARAFQFRRNRSRSEGGDGVPPRRILG